MKAVRVFLAERVGGVRLAKEVSSTKEEEEVGVEAENDDKDNGTWDKLEDAGKVEAGGDGAVAATEAEAAKAKGDGVDDERDKPEDGPEPADAPLDGEGEGGQRKDEDDVGDNGDREVPKVL